MYVLKDIKLLFIAVTVMLVSEAIGVQKIPLTGTLSIMLLPMLYAMLLGGIISLPKLKILNPKNMEKAGALMSVALVLLVAKLATSVGADWETVKQSGFALILQEVGHFMGTILLGLPIAIMLGMGREAVGATYSIGREPNIAIVEAKYGLNSPEGRGVMSIYICGTLYGAVWMSILASLIAGMNILNPLALAMGAGVGSGSMLAAALLPIQEYYPDQAEKIQALAGSANLMSGVLGIYIYMFFSLPFASFLYDFIKGRKEKRAQSPE